MNRRNAETAHKSLTGKILTSLRKVFRSTRETEQGPPASPSILQEVARCRETLAALELHMRTLEMEVKEIREASQLFDKAFRVAGFAGDYIEFGVYRGDSFVQAYLASRRVVEEFLSGRWNHAFGDPETAKRGFEKAWNAMRFVAFDSFQGMPQPKGLDALSPVFPKGSYACTEEEFLANVKEHGVPEQKIVTVPGFFSGTLSQDTAQRLSLRHVSVVHIDSDLYESARLALEFCTPFFRDGTVIVFDEWYQFAGNPALGERRAFDEWTHAHPEWIATPFQKEGAFRNSFVLTSTLTGRTGVEPELSKHPAFFDGEEPLGGGWYYLRLKTNTVFGYYSYATFPWLYHLDLGYVYFIASEANDGAYIYDASLQQWFYTDPSSFPALYNFSAGAWYWYEPDKNNPEHYTRSPRWFVNLTTGTWIHSP